MTEIPIDSPEVTVVLKDMPTHIRGFVCLGSDYRPCVIINSRMPREQQLKTYNHELKHIMKGEIYDTAYTEYQKTESKGERNRNSG